jgi:hypothetical protein
MRKVRTSFENTVGHAECMGSVDEGAQSVWLSQTADW